MHAFTAVVESKLIYLQALTRCNAWTNESKLLSNSLCMHLYVLVKTYKRRQLVTSEILI